MIGEPVSDRLYAVSLRPLEWDGLRSGIVLTARWGPLGGAGDAPARRHWFLLVVEGRARLAPDDPLAQANPDGLEVLRAGWECELAVPTDLPPEAVAAPPALARSALARIAAVVNRLAGDAGVAELLDAAAVAALSDRIAAAA